MFLGIPHSPRDEVDFIDWTDKDTYDITGSYDGITDLAKIEEIDPALFRTIKQSIQAIPANLGANAQFNWVRSWSDFPGVVFNISVENTEFGILEFDVNLYHPNEYFGVEHAKRFNEYIDRVKKHYGESRALQILADIRKLKSLVRIASTVDGKIDKGKKIPGFVVESLFTVTQKPRSFDQVITDIAHTELTQSDQSQLPDRIGNQEEQLVKSDKNLSELLKTLTKGGYHTLKSIAQKKFTTPSM